MNRQAITLAATAALGLGTLLSGYSRADDKAAQPAGDNSASGQTAPQGDAANGASAQSAAQQGGQGNFKQALQAANDPDKLFVVMASVDNQCEVQLSQLAQQKSQDAQVKKIAQRMIDDHQKAEQQLQQTAKAIGLECPTSLPMTKQQEMTVFQSLNGKDFDQQYISHLRAGHAMAVSKYTDVAQLAKNDQVKQYAQQQLPILQEHFQHVQQAATALGLPNQMEAQTAGARIGGSASDQNQPQSNGQTDAGSPPAKTDSSTGQQGTGAKTNGQ